MLKKVWQVDGTCDGYLIATHSFTLQRYVEGHGMNNVCGRSVYL